MKSLFILIGWCCLWVVPVWAGPTQTILEGYRAAGAGDFSAARGQALYHKSFPGENPHEQRQCITCHHKDPKQPGQHPKTGKRIPPLAPSADPARLQDPAHVEKWFERNCTWTVGRSCTPQEKGDFLTFLLAL
ncbi:MAG: DUF1924 domain-containing protein [Magnetococcales bacterium]|nr:DUF1924 domain-containing protein [Magnetococcales bacterium]NGZ07164.1 DUF1924 domain-containing protein [Magnetococcales bacterium]